MGGCRVFAPLQPHPQNKEFYILCTTSAFQNSVSFSGLRENGLEHKVNVFTNDLN